MKILFRCIVLGVILLLLLNSCASLRSRNDNHTGLRIRDVMKIDEGRIGEAYHPCEPTICINPQNTNNIVAGAILDRVYFSRDGGVSWKKARLTSSHGVYGDPVVVADSGGVFYYSHLSNPSGEGWSNPDILDRIVVQRSEDGGETWSNGSFVGLNQPKDQDKQWKAIDPTNNDLVITWTEFDSYGDESPLCESRILFSRSSDGGQTWSLPVNINQWNGNCLDGDKTVEGAVPAIDSEGKIYVAWAYDEKIYMDISNDKGRTWLSEDIIVADQPGGWELEVGGLNRCNGMPVTVVDNSASMFHGSVYVNWVDARNGENNEDVWLSYSRDSGITWSSPVRVNNDTTEREQFLTWMDIDDKTGFIYIVFYDRRSYDDLRTDVYLAWSCDGGRTFQNQKISEKPFTPYPQHFFGDYNNISVYDGIIRPIWTQMDKKTTSIWTAIISHE